jgi:parallel beta-helix repeat protein
MKRSRTILSILIPLSCVFFAIVFTSYANAASVTYVDDDADPGWYNATQVKTIQEGIDNVSASGIVYIWNGIYNENVIVNKTVSIIGNGSSIVTVDAGGTLSAINVTAEWVNVSGVRTNNSGTIFFANAGIIINANYTNISNCNSSSNGADGIIISDEFDYMHNVSIYNCTIYSNADDGIMLQGAYYCDIVNNIIRSNVDDAIYPCWVQSHNNSIHGNNCTGNNNSIYISQAKDNIIYNNYFGDIATTYLDGGNIWNVTKVLGTNIIGGPYIGGNYWSSYTGYELDGDGLGDTDIPYNCSGNITIGGDYHPLTKNTIPVTIAIKFAGNLGDSGGPYFIPPTESGTHAADGYYANSSYQIENWTYINSTIEGGTIDSVILHWYDLTSDIWDNTTSLVNTAGNYYEVNTSGNITIISGHEYSFDIYANNTAGNESLIFWNKTGKTSTLVRRTVHLGCTPVNMNYTILYFYNEGYVTTDTGDDRLTYDGGTDGSEYAFGYLSSIVPGDEVILTACNLNVGWLFGNASAIIPFTLENFLIHAWYSSDDGDLDTIGWTKTRQIFYFFSAYTDSYNPSVANSKSNITYDNGYSTYSNNYHLESKLFDIADTSFTDNDVYEFYFGMAESGVGGSQDPTSINNRSFTSYLITNVPDNATLNSTYPDSDSDGLSDWFEIYKLDTNPRINDTDADGVTDYWEWMSGSDPNNWRSTLMYNYAPSMPVPYPLDNAISVSRTIGNLKALISDLDGDTCNVSFYWGDGTPIGTANNVANNTNASVPIPDLLAGQQYFWYVNVTDGDKWTRGPTSGNWTFTVASSSHPPGDGDGDGDGDDDGDDDGNGDDGVGGGGGNGNGDDDITPPATNGPGVTADYTGAWMIMTILVVCGCIMAFAYLINLKKDKDIHSLKRNDDGTSR